VQDAKLGQAPGVGQLVDDDDHERKREGHNEHDRQQQHKSREGLVQYALAQHLMCHHTGLEGEDLTPEKVSHGGLTAFLGHHQEAGRQLAVLFMVVEELEGQDAQLYVAV
jgi:hypothetical protein